MSSEAWRRPFFTLYSGQAFFLLTSSAVQFALIWWITVKTGSPLALTLASLLGLAPQIVLGPLAGVFIDRYPRKMVMILADLLVAVASVILALSFLFGEPLVEAVYALLFLRALGETFQKPALQATIPSVVPPQALQQAGGLGQLVASLSGLVGPMLGALLIQTLPLPVVVLVDVVGAGLAILTLSLVSLNAQTFQATKMKLFAEIGQGVRVLFGNRTLVVASGLIFLTSLIVMPLGSLLPLLVNQFYLGSAWQAGLVQTLFSVGMLLAALVLGVFRGQQKPFTMIAVSTLLVGIFLFSASLVAANAFWLFCLFVLGIGAASMVGNIPFMAAIQASVAQEHLGKVISTVTSLVSLGIPLGMAVAGPIAASLGIGRWMMGAGVLLTLIGGLSLFVFRARRS